MRRIAAPLLLVALLLAGCENRMWDDPKSTYDLFVKDVNSGNLGAIYDRMDTARRRDFDRTVDRQLAQIDALPAAERAKWEELKKKNPRDRFAAIIAGDPSFMATLKGRYAVARIDTFVVLTVKHEGADTALVYLRRENDSMKLSGPPARPEPQIPEEIRRRQEALRNQESGARNQGAQDSAAKKGAGNTTPGSK